MMHPVFAWEESGALGEGQPPFLRKFLTKLSWGYEDALALSTPTPISRDRCFVRC
jgi:hypothetical protein